MMDFLAVPIRLYRICFTQRRGDKCVQINCFADLRMKQLGRRLIFFERPDLFSTDMRQKLDRMLARRILGA